MNRTIEVTVILAIILFATVAVAEHRSGVTRGGTTPSTGTGTAGDVMQFGGTTINPDGSYHDNDNNTDSAPEAASGTGDVTLQSIDYNGESYGYDENTGVV